MVILEIFKENTKIVYKTTLLSKGTILYCVCGLFLYTLPYIFGFTTAGFWLKRDVFYEQPNVKFKGDYILIATTTDLDNPIICTANQYKEWYQISNPCILTKGREVDRNLDGKVDQLLFKFSLNLEKNIKITSINLIVPLDFKLETVCPLQMESAIIYQFSNQPLVTGVFVQSDLKIFQASAVKCRRRHIDTVYNYPIYKQVNIINIGDDVEKIITEYLDRNITTHLTNIVTTYQTGIDEHIFTFKMLVRFPEVKIYYKPGLWQVLKWAWIQYFAIYVIISWIITKIKSYIFHNKLVLFYEVSPVKKYT